MGAARGARPLTLHLLSWLPGRVRCTGVAATSCAGDAATNFAGDAADAADAATNFAGDAATNFTGDAAGAADASTNVTGGAATSFAGDAADAADATGAATKFAGDFAGDAAIGFAGVAADAAVGGTYDVGANQVTALNVGCCRVVGPTAAGLQGGADGIGHCPRQCSFPPVRLICFTVRYAGCHSSWNEFVA